MVLIFGVMGFASNLFYRAIWLYCEWREGNMMEWNRLDWGKQAFLTFGVPGAWVFFMLVSLYSTGMVLIP